MESLDIFLQQNRVENKDSAEQKKILRKNLISKRIELFKKHIDKNRWGERQFFSALAKLNISSSQELQNKFRVACFFPIRAELNFLPFAQSNWLFPKVNGAQLQWFEYGDGHTNFVLNTWGIPEKTNASPLEDLLPLNTQLVCFVPGLAGDQNGYRLGYGGGYYDQFLKKHTTIISVLCLPSAEFFFDNLPHEAHDMKISHIIY